MKYLKKFNEASFDRIEEFIKMALEWGQPDGYVLDENYVAEQSKQPNYRPSFINMSNYYK